MDARRVAPHVALNADPIIAVLSGILPPRGHVLEIASGSGEHVVRFARAFPGLTFQPSDPDPDALASIDAWRAAEAVDNVVPAIALDAADAEWGVGHCDAILCINMVHISPWEATCGLVKGAGRLLGRGSLLFLYGAYRQHGVPTAPSNEAFDASLKARDPRWGLRFVEDVAAEAEGKGLQLERIVPMPANNLSLIFRA